MNIFVLNTGRCGSTTFIKACGHIINFTCSHESRTGLLGNDRFDYPPNHIEADNRLTWLLGRLDKTYGNKAFYVHLKRNEEDTAHSFTMRYSGGIIKAYRGDGVLMGLPEESDPMSVALDYCDTVNSNIDLFLRDKTQKIEINLECIESGFREFWEEIGAKGDIMSALAELSKLYNASQQSHHTAQEPRLDKNFSQKLRNLKKLARKYLDCVKDA